MKVMLATDGSAGARSATEFLARLPLPADTTVLVLAVADVPLPMFETAPVRLWGNEIVAGLRLAADDAVQTLKARWPTAELRAPGGDPRTAIAEHAEEARVDLLVVGARGLGTFAGLMLGSVSNAVVRDAHCPVLVAKGVARDVRRVLVATDGSADAIAAARFVASLPLPASTRISLIGVVAPPDYPLVAPELGTPMLWEAIEQIVAERRRVVTEALADVVPAFGGRVELETIVADGHPADEILRAAKNGGADLVVTGARGLGPVKRLLLGSVSERVLHGADCPVLVVKR
jgi:nucleotide-binding universal stress UspA family protein